jgi:hypothetical protein
MIFAAFSFVLCPYLQRFNMTSIHHRFVPLCLLRSKQHKPNTQTPRLELLVCNRPCSAMPTHAPSRCCDWDSFVCRRRAEGGLLPARGLALSLPFSIPFPETPSTSESLRGSVSSTLSTLLPPPFIPLSQLSHPPPPPPLSLRLLLPLSRGSESISFILSTSLSTLSLPPSLPHDAVAPSAFTPIISPHK